MSNLILYVIHITSCKFCILQFFVAEIFPKIMTHFIMPTCNKAYNTYNRILAMLASNSNYSTIGTVFLSVPTNSFKEFKLMEIN